MNSTNAPQPPSGQYVIDPSKSTVTFTTKHMFGLGEVRGRFDLAQGIVTVAEHAEDSSVSAEISAASFASRNPMRDLPVRSPMFLSSRRHPLISFRADGAKRDGSTWVAAGTLTVKGKSAPVVLTVTDIERVGASTVFTAHATVDRFAHGITMFRGMAARHLSFDITAHVTEA